MSASDRPHVLAVAQLLAPQMEQLRTHFELHELFGLSPAERAQAAQRLVSGDGGVKIRGLITNGGLGADAALLGALPDLEIVSSNGVGTDAIDRKVCAQRGVHVCNTPDVLTADVADLALALLLDVSRRVSEGDRVVRQGKFALGLGRAVQGKRVGLVGMGRIGQAIARRCTAFEMTVAYHTPRAKPDLPYHYEPDLVALARDCDYLVLACPGGAETRGLVSAAVLEALGPQGYLINVSRGSVVDEPALVRALVSGAIAGAGLDVFADEPRVPQELWSLEQVVLLPHIGSGTVETRTAMGQLVVDNLVAHFAGQPLVTPVPPPAL